MKKYLLESIGVDGWNRVVYKCKNTGRLFCDIDLKEPYSEKANIHTKYKGFNGEPDYPINKNSYEFIKEGIKK